MGFRSVLQADMEFRQDPSPLGNATRCSCLPAPPVHSCRARAETQPLAPGLPNEPRGSSHPKILSFRYKCRNLEPLDYFQKEEFGPPLFSPNKAPENTKIPRGTNVPWDPYWEPGSLFPSTYPVPGS